MDKKTTLIIALSISTLIFMIYGIIQSGRATIILYENMQYAKMHQLVKNYADKTADTGEFDSFLTSEEGIKYYNIAEEIE